MTAPLVIPKMVGPAVVVTIGKTKHVVGVHEQYGWQPSGLPGLGVHYTRGTEELVIRTAPGGITVRWKPEFAAQWRKTTLADETLVEPWVRRFTSREKVAA